MSLPCKNTNCVIQATFPDGYCEKHHNQYERRLERNRMRKQGVLKPKKAKVVAEPEASLPTVVQQEQEVSREQVQTLEHRHIQRDIQLDRVVREFHPDGSKASEVVERTTTREEEDTRSYEARIVDRHKMQITQAVRNKMEHAAEAVQYDQLYVFKQHGHWYETNILPRLPKDPKTQMTQLSQLIDEKMISPDGIRYFEDDFGPISVLINYMLFSRAPADQLPELTAIYTYAHGFSQGLVWTNWNIPGGRFHFVQLSSVIVPLLGLQRYAKDSKVIARQLEEYQANEIANEEIAYDEAKYKLDRFALSVKGSIRE